ncbi:MAG TPA: Fe-S cluster assembly protein SufD, partial [Luteimonas sp.]|nr:Fe-S cluster assembly protein SufD [Luteimonas sp.]
ETGLPAPRSEAWKYTSLRALERRTFSVADRVAPAFDPALLEGIAAPRLVFVNGRHSPAHSDLRTLQQGLAVTVGMVGQDGAEVAGGADAVFARLNAALAAEGATIGVAPGVHVDAPLHLVFVGATTGADHAWHLRHRIQLDAGSRLTLVEHHLGAGAHRHLDNTLSSVMVGEGARLEHVRVQSAAEGAVSVLRTDATLARDATCVRLDLELGAALTRHELNVRLQGDRACIEAGGVLAAGGRRHVDTRLGIEHLARDTRSTLLWRGLAAERGRAVFHGGITIHAGADGSDANLSNKNLLLGDQAGIDTQPVLVIHADEVKAAHGATVGQLDDNAMFYLRSRGLPEPEARGLLMAAFVREPLAAIADPALRGSLQARLDVALGGGATA